MDEKHRVQTWRLRPFLRAYSRRLFKLSSSRHRSVSLTIAYIFILGGVHRVSLVRYPHITEDTLKALSLCKNLESMIWIDDSSTSHTMLLSFLAVVRPHPLREITIRTHSDLGETVWSELITLTGLRKISIWCMEGPPRVLQGWSESLGDSLTHLELGVSLFSYPCSERTC